MDEPIITRSARKMLIDLYRVYLERLEAGALMKNARAFGSETQIQTLVAADMPVEDVMTICRELRDNNFLKINDAGSSFYGVWLTNYGIANVEKYFKDRLHNFASVALKVVELTSFPFR